MTKPRDNSLAELRKSNERLKLTIANKLLEHKAKRLQNRYDHVDSNGKRRRASSIEVAGETGPNSLQMPPNLRLVSVALARDAQRNYSSARAILKQIRLNTIGRFFEMTCTAPGAEEAVEWFNGTFAPSADFRGDRHVVDLWGQALDSVVRDGDCLQWFDDGNGLDTGAKGGTGRLAYWESDQICSITEGLPKGVTCHDGIMLDQFGREIGYVATSHRGRQTVKPSEAVIFRRDPLNDSANNVALLRMPWRLNQGRGVSELSPSIGDLLDCYEMRASELQSAKLVAKMPLKVTRKDAVENLDDERLDPDYQGTDEGPAAESTLPEDADAEAQYERFEALAGGYIEYLADGDNVEPLDFNRPNINTVAFIESVLKSSGAGFGLARVYATLQADASFSATRGEFALSWVLFDYLQWWAAHYIKTWTAYRAISHAIKTGKIKTAPAPGWEKAMQWPAPEMPQIDTTKEQAAIAQAMKNADTDLTQVVGPNWRKRIDALSEQRKYCDEKGVKIDGLNAEASKSPAPSVVTERPDTDPVDTPDPSDNGKPDGDADDE